MTTTTANEILCIDEYASLSFDDFPEESQTEGKGRHMGTWFRTLTCEAINEEGREHCYTLRWTRHEAPEAVLARQLEVALRRAGELQNQDTSRVRNFSAYCVRLHRANERVDELSLALSKAQNDGLPALSDSLKLINRGRTEAQRQRDLEAKREYNSGRPSAPFIEYILKGTGIEPNETQWEIIADYLEGMRSNPPFYFMGDGWMPVLGRADAVQEDGEGFRLDGQQFRDAYKRFLAGETIAA